MMAQVVWAAPLLIGHLPALATGAAATEALPAAWNGTDLIVGAPRRAAGARSAATHAALRTRQHCA
jgi:hypothetical protein